MAQSLMSLISIAKSAYGYKSVKLKIIVRVKALVVYKVLEWPKVLAFLALDSRFSS